MTLFEWQNQSAAQIEAALLKHRIAADGSEMGTGKTFKACAIAKRLGRSLVVVCPKAVIPEWLKVAAMWGVPCQAFGYEAMRAGKTGVGRWQHKGVVFEWTFNTAQSLLVLDEAHRCGGNDTQQSKLLIAAKRQNFMTLLMSGTMIATPMKAKAIGYALGLHQLTNFYPWMLQHGVKQGFFGLEWKPSEVVGKQIMERIRISLGDRFSRIRKADVPNFPQNQIIPTFVQTKEMPELEGGDYGVDARMAVEMLKVAPMVEQVEGLLEGGFSVAVFVNFIASLEALQQRFPDAGIIRGGQSNLARTTVINSFQQNENFVLLIMAQAGGTGLSLHDLNGRPRAALISPGHSAVEFLQVLGRIHRAGSLSPAVNYIILASGVPVERRIRFQLETKLNNLAALNDHDLYGNASHDSAGTSPAHHGTASRAVALDGHEHPIHHDAGDLPGVDAIHPCGGAEHGSGSGSNPAPIGAGTGQPIGGGEDGLGRSSSGEGVQPMSTALPGIEAATQPKPTTLNFNAATVAHVERKHARCSPSKLKNLEICPSYEGDNDGPVHPITLRGTAMHEALETGNDSGLLPDNENEELRLVQMCRDFEAGEAQPGDTIIREPHLKTHDRDVQGFADRLVLRVPGENGRRTILIRDYKMGFNLVDSPDINPQSIAYTVAAFMKYADADEVNFAFLIPRCDAVLEHTFHRVDLPGLKLRLSLIADRVREFAGKIYNVNNGNCLYCGGKATCEALMKKALVIANSYNEDDKLALPTEFHSSLITDPVQMAKALNVAEIMAKWSESVKSHALKLRMEVGLEIPGYSLTERSSKRTITSANAAWDIAQTFGVTQEEFMGAATLSLPSLETAVKARVTKGKAAKCVEFNDALRDAGAVSQGGKYWMLSKDKKKAAEPDTTPTVVLTE